MKIKSIHLFLTLLFGVFMVGCKKDEVHTVVSFDKTGNRNNFVTGEGTTSNIINASGPAITISTPLASDLQVSIESSGTATLNKDYSFNRTVIIPQGRREANIGLLLVDDKEFEYDETIKFRITSVNNPLATLDTVVSRVTIKDDEQSLLSINLFWDPLTDPAGKFYDMDLYLWHESSPGSNNFDLVDHAAKHPTSLAEVGNYLGNIHESRSLGPLAADGLYGLSLVYYDGDEDALAVQVNLEALGLVTMDGPAFISRTATYRLSNLNKGKPTVRELYFTKTGTKITNITNIVVPGNGS